MSSTVSALAAFGGFIKECFRKMLKDLTGMSELGLLGQLEKACTRSLCLGTSLGRHRS